MPLFRNFTAAFSSVAITRLSDSARALTGPSNPSILRKVPRATLAFWERSDCAHPRSALAALMCLPVITINEENITIMRVNPIS